MTCAYHSRRVGGWDGSGHSRRVGGVVAVEVAAVYAATDKEEKVAPCSIVIGVRRPMLLYKGLRCVEKEGGTLRYRCTGSRSSCYNMKGRTVRYLAVRVAVSDATSRTATDSPPTPDSSRCSLIDNIR